MSVGFISTRRRLTRTASSQMGERWHVAGNQDDPRPSPPDRATSRTSVRSQAHWGLELELRRPGALAARLLRVVSGSPAAARVWCEERSSPNFASHRILLGSSPETYCRDIKRWPSPIARLSLFLGNVDLLKTQPPSSNRLIISSSLCLHTETPSPSANQVLQHAVAGASNCLLLALPPFCALLGLGTVHTSA